MHVYIPMVELHFNNYAQQFSARFKKFQKKKHKMQKLLGAVHK